MEVVKELEGKLQQMRAKVKRKAEEVTPKCVN